VSAHPVVLVTGADLAPQAVDMLRDYTIVYAGKTPDEQQLIDLCREHQPVAFIVRYGRITPAVIEASAQLRVISKHGTGIDTIDAAAAAARGIAVKAALGANAAAKNVLQSRVTFYPRAILEPARHTRQAKPGAHARHVVGGCLPDREHRRSDWPGAAPAGASLGRLGHRAHPPLWHACRRAGRHLRGCCRPRRGSARWLACAAGAIAGIAAARAGGRFN
jgi:hypothetical protein